MVKYDSILKIMDNYVQKCTDYPKYQALKYFKEHMDEFQEERYDSDPNRIPSPQGHFQRMQEQLQEDVEYDAFEQATLEDYQTNSFIPLGYYLNDGLMPTTKNEMRQLGFTFGGYIQNEDGDFLYGDRADEKGVFVVPVHYYPDGRENGNHEYITLSMAEEDKHISSAIQKSPPLQQDTVLYSYRELPLDIKEGNHGVIKNYGSCSFNEHVCEDIRDNGEWVQGEKDRRYMCKIYAMKGTQGVVLNERITDLPPWQSEWLLNKNQRYIVWSKNDDDMTAEIILY